MTGSDVLHAGLNVHRIDVGLGVLHVDEGSQADGTWREILVSGGNERKSWNGWTSPAPLQPCTPAPAPAPSTKPPAPCPLRTLPLHPGHRGDKLQQLPEVVGGPGGTLAPPPNRPCAIAYSNCPTRPSPTFQM